MESFLVSLLIGVLGALALKAAFSVARVSWPENYFDSSRQVSEWFVETPLRVMFWRVAPFVLGVIVVAAVSVAVGAEATSALWVFYATHILTTNVLSLASTLLSGGGMSGRIVYAITVSVVLAILILFAQFNLDRLAKVTPEFDEVVQGTWTAIIAALIFAAYRIITRARVHVGTPAKSLANLGIDDYYVGYLAHRAHLMSVDLPLLLAITSVESRNRPSWMRGMEVFMYSILRSTGVPKTIGIAQQASDASFSRSMRWRWSIADYDRRSMLLLAKSLAGCVPDSNGMKLGPFEVKALANRINGGSKYLSSVASVYDEMYFGNNAIMCPVIVNVPDHDESAIELLLARDSSMPVEGLFIELFVNSPWAVRYRESTYVQLKLPCTLFESLTIDTVGDLPSSLALSSRTFTNSDAMFKDGLFKVEGGGCGLRLTVRDRQGIPHELPALHFTSERDVCLSTGNI